MIPHAAISAAVIAGIAGLAPAAPITYTETFDDGLNHTGWTWDRTALGSVQGTGGNPGGFFRSALQAAPSLFCSDDLFTGNYVDRAVGSIGGDLRTVEFATATGMISIGLFHHNGTPDNPFDDTVASFVSTIESPTNPDFGWVSFDFDIPFAAADTPADWRLTGVLPFIPATVDWQTLMANVDEVVISWSDPGQPTLLFDSVRGADNLRVTYAVPAPGAIAPLGLLLACRRSRRRA